MNEANSTIALWCLSGFLALMLVHAWHGSRETKSLSDYLVGGRMLGGVAIALSFFATFVSSVTFVGLAGRSWSLGPAWCVVCTILFTTAVFVSWFLVAPRFFAFASHYRVLTIPGFLERRYDSRLLQRLSGAVVVIASVVYMTAVYDGAARTLEGLLQIEGVLVMGLVFLIVTAYTLAGGFRAVVATDGVQGVLLLIGAIALPAVMLFRAGGPGAILEAVETREPGALQFTTGLPLLGLIGTALGVALKIVVEPRLLSRFYGLSSDQQIRRGRWLAPALLFVTYLCLLPAGMLAHAFVPAEISLQSDEVIPWLLSSEGNVLGTVGGSLLLTALAAAAMSSLDSVLLVAAGSIECDVLPDRSEDGSSVDHQTARVRRTRIWVFVLSAIAASLALIRARGIVELSSLSGSLYAACFLPTLIVGLFWPRATRAAAVAALLAGFVATSAWFVLKKIAFSGALTWLHEIYVGLFVSVPIFVVVSKLTPVSETHAESTST